MVEGGSREKNIGRRGERRVGNMKGRREECKKVGRGRTPGEGGRREERGRKRKKEVEKEKCRVVGRTEARSVR